MARALIAPHQRQRRDDLPELAARLVARHAAAAGRPGLRLDPRCPGLLSDCDWPGNGAQLDALLEAAVRRATGEAVLPKDLGLPLPEEYVVRRTGASPLGPVPGSSAGAG